jgi:LeuA allosteric (dimerisation) domain
VQMRFGWDQSTFGVGIDANIVTAALKAIIAGLNRGIELGYLQKPVVGGEAKVANG